MTDPTDDPQHDTARQRMEAMLAAMRRPRERPTEDGGDDRQLAAVAWRAVNVPLRESSEAVSAATEQAPAMLEGGAKVGRYVVLRVLGAGGMGVVYAAYDPELDRRIALKLVAPGMADDDGRTRLLREAQALAKLSHRNVVAIHDVGTMGEQVWLAMELVRGQTLREWLRERRSWREVLEVMREAGRGLAAAHAAGLLHRDFKPENVMIGRDGQVLVMDFGLARARPNVALEADESTQGAVPLVSALALGVTQAGAVVGTPRYMAPEQLLGREATAAVDQFALCVTLWEGLYGERPFEGETLDELLEAVIRGKVRRPAKGRGVPGWLRRVCERGLRFDAEQRFASMEGLLEALAKGRARARVRMAVTGVGALAVAGLGVEGYQRFDEAQRTAACEASGDEIEEAWNEERKQALRDGILATGVSYAPTTAEKVMPWLDRQAAEWREARVEACMDAEVRGRWGSEMLDRSLWCLDERRMQLESLVDELMVADGVVVQKAVTAAAGLASVGSCRDERALVSMGPPPEERREAVRVVRAAIVRAGNLSRAGRYELGLEVAREALKRAEVLDWPRLATVARLQLGKLLESMGDYAAAERTMEDVYFAAAEGSAPELAADAAVGLVFLVGVTLARHAEAQRWGRHAAVALAEVGAGDHLLEASLLGELASVHWASGTYDEAEALYRRVLAIREKALGAEHPAVAHSLQNLAVVRKAVGDYDEAIAIYERALAIQEDALGSEHPDMATILGNLASLHLATGAYEATIGLGERALAVQEKALGPEHPDVAVTLVNLALAHEASGSRSRAIVLGERALAIQEKALGPEHPRVATSLTNLGLVHLAVGDHEKAMAFQQRALAIDEKTLGPHHPDVAYSLVNLGVVHKAIGNDDEAVALFERALAIREGALGREHPYVAYPLVGLAEVALVQRRLSDAISLAGRAVVVREKGNAPDEELGKARFVLARALWEAPADGGRDRVRAMILAEQARDAYLEAGKAHASDLAEVEQWLATHRTKP